MRRKLAAGNWKMNGTRASLAELAVLAKTHAASEVDILICPPATLLTAACGHAPLMIGAQDCHMATSGAHTGDISAAQIKDAGATAVIVGHSERRVAHEEHSEIVRAKARAALRCISISRVTFNVMPPPYTPCSPNMSKACARALSMA